MSSLGGSEESRGSFPLLQSPWKHTSLVLLCAWIPKYHNDGGCGMSNTYTLAWEAIRVLKWSVIRHNLIHSGCYIYFLFSFFLFFFLESQVVKGYFAVGIGKIKCENKVWGTGSAT